MSKSISELVEETGAFSPELRAIVGDILRERGPQFVFGAAEPTELLEYPQGHQPEWISQNHMPLTVEAAAIVRQRLTA